MSNKVLTQLIKPEAWLNYMASQFDVSVKNNSLYFDNMHGKGSIKNFLLEDGLTLSRVELLLKKDMEFERMPSDKPLVMLNLFLPDKGWELEVEQKQYMIDKKLANGIFLTTSRFPAINRIKAQSRYHYFAFLMSKSWLLANDLLQDEQFLTEKKLSKPLFFLKHANISILQTSKSLFQATASMEVKLLFELRSEALSLLATALSMLKQQNFSKHYSKINQQDADVVISLSEQIIQQSGAAIPSVQEIASSVYMSPSKFRNLYNSIFGESYFKHIRKQQLIKAKEMLQSNQFTVSEVGYEIGYSNLSKFSKAFKSQFGILPKEVTSAKSGK